MAAYEGPSGGVGDYHRPLGQYGAKQQVVVSRADYNGLVARVVESGLDCATAKRIELFGKTRQKIFGILHTFFVAYSSSNSVLQLGETSSNVIQVRALSSEKGHLEQDRLVLKRPDLNPEPQGVSPYRQNIPDLFVPAVWREKMRLISGDKIVVSTPAGEYTIPAPDPQNNS